MTRQRLLLIAIAVILVLLAYNFLVYQPRQARYRVLTAELTSRVAERDRLQAIAQRGAALEEQAQELQATIAVVEAKLPDEKEIPELLVQLEQLVASLQVGLSTISPGAIQAPPSQAAGAAPPGGAPSATPPYATIPVRLTIAATYQRVIELMGALQDFPRLMAVRTVAVSPGNLPTLNVDVGAEIYVLVRGAR